MASAPCLSDNYPDNPEEGVVCLKAEEPGILSLESPTAVAVCQKGLGFFLSASILEKLHDPRTTGYLNLIP